MSFYSGRKSQITIWFPAILVGLVIGVAAYFWQFAPASSSASGVTVFAVGTLPAVAFDGSASTLPTPISAVATPIFLEPAANIFNAPEEGQPAPDFTLPNLAGEAVSLADFAGQPMLINFWASWCSPCRAEMPDLIRAYEAHKEEGFVILGINTTFQDSRPGIDLFMQEFNMTFPVLLDETGEVTNEMYQMLGLPMSVFVDTDGIIQRIRIGGMTGAQIDEYIAEILE